MRTFQLALIFLTFLLVINAYNDEYNENSEEEETTAIYYEEDEEDNQQTGPLQIKYLPKCEGIKESVSSCIDQNPTEYCLNSEEDGMIYGINGETICKLDLGTYVFSVDKTATLVTADTSNLIENSLVIYQCSTYKDKQNQNQDVEKCIKTAGYVNVNSLYYSVPSSDQDVSRLINTNNLNNECYNYDNESIVGRLVNYYSNRNISLCMKYSNSPLKFPNSISDDGKNYLLIDNMKYNINNINKVTTGPFYNINTSKKLNSGIVITSSYAKANRNPTMLYFNSFYSETNYCYDSYGELINRKEYLCRKKSGNSCSYYYCTDGICKVSDSTCPKENENACLPNDSDGQSNCDDGYYIVTRDSYSGIYKLATTEIDNGFLYYCEGGFCKSMSRMYGFFENSNVKNKSDYPYIKCVYSSNNWDYDDNKMCNLVREPTVNICSKAGDLIKSKNNIEICLSSKNDSTVPLKSDTVDYKFVNIEVIRPNSSNNIILMLDKNSVHTIYDENDNDSYFLINESSKEIYKDPGFSGIVYYCRNLYCYSDTSIVGYIFNAPYKYNSNYAPYIQCFVNENKYGCSTITITKTKCNGAEEDSAKGGELFKTTKTVNGVESNEFNICLDTTNANGISVPIQYSYIITSDMRNGYYSTSSIRVMVSTNTKYNIFGYKSNKYIVAEINNNNIIRKNYIDLYKHTFENNMVIDGSMLRYTETCDNPNSIIEFELVCIYDSEYSNNFNYYRKSEDNYVVNSDDNKNGDKP